MSKPPTKGTPTALPQTRVTSSKTHQTRSATMGKAIQSERKNVEVVDHKQLSTASTHASTPLSELVEILSQFVSIYKLDNAAKTRMEEIITLARAAVEKERRSERILEEQITVSGIRKAILADLHSMYNTLATHIGSVQDTANAALSNTDKVLSITEELRGGTNDLISKVGNVTSVADKIANTTQSYRDVLVANRAPSHKDTVDPRILGDVERKAKQILIETFDKEEDGIAEKSLTEIVNKANEVISMTDADKPEKVLVEMALKTRKGAILLTLNSKEAADWIREPENEMVFADTFAKGAHIRDREFTLVAPGVPLTFEPSSATHLREIEETNRLPSHVIRKARWIKPIGRRRPGQTHAYAILSVASVDIANKLIKDGLAICGRIIHPMKQKQEPSQCMKCRRWGHFAANCPDPEDTCGTCGGKHRTNNCGSKDKLHCVSCGDSSHASWDRACPEFIKRCAIIDERNPLNSMPFFPSDQDWTLVSRPKRIPLNERFPAPFAVNSLPTTGMRTAGPAQHRKTGVNRGTKAPRENPNLIPLPAKSKHTSKEAGELTDQEGEPSWMREPVWSTTQYFNSNGEFICNSDGWD